MKTAFCALAVITVLMAAIGCFSESFQVATVPCELRRIDTVRRWQHPDQVRLTWLTPYGEMTEDIAADEPHLPLHAITRLKIKR